MGESAIIHNGIIEKFKELCTKLAAKARLFENETDSEVVIHLISAEIEAGANPFAAVTAVLPHLRGVIAVVINLRAPPRYVDRGAARLGVCLALIHEY